MSTVTVTEQEQNDDCGWRWDFNSMNRMSLEPVTPLKALWLGTLVHKSLDLLAATTLLTNNIHSYAGPAWDPFNDKEMPSELCPSCGLPALTHVPQRSIYDLFAEQQRKRLIDSYTEKMGVPPNSVELKDSLETINLGRAMFNNYLNYYKTPLPPELEYISTEQSLITELPGTEHCACSFYTDCQCLEERKTNSDTWLVFSCRSFPQEMSYTYCSCSGKSCSCRQLHKIESTLDGLVRRVVDHAIFILENKTFTFHPKRPDLLRANQFMGYTWTGNQHGLDIQGVLYNGLWKRAQVPEKSKWKEHDLFTREYLPFTRFALDEWGKQSAIKALRMFDPQYVPTRNVHAVGGCNGVNQCHYKALCDARFEQVNYEFTLSTRYQKRERTSIFAEQEVDVA